MQIGSLRERAVVSVVAGLFPWAPGQQGASWKHIMSISYQGRVPACAFLLVFIAKLPTEHFEQTHSGTLWT